MKIPDLGERVNHILTKQVFGIGITHLTSLLARRSVYCSKHAIGAHSIAKGFASDTGNIWFERLEHTWGDARCRYCGAPRTIFDREAGLETHAYGDAAGAALPQHGYPFAMDGRRSRHVRVPQDRARG
jgi:site-specific DNA-methyltransferase (adenine-specific)